MKELTPEGQAVYPKDTYMPENTDIPQGPALENKGTDTAVREPVLREGVPNPGGESNRESRPAAPGGGNTENVSHSNIRPSIPLDSFKNDRARALAEDVVRSINYFSPNYREQVFTQLRILRNQGELTEKEGDTIRNFIDASAVNDISYHEAQQDRAVRDEVMMELSRSMASDSIVQGLLSPEERERLLTTTVDRVVAERAKGRRGEEPPMVNNREITSKSLIPQYLEAMQAVSGDVDEQGKLLGTGFDTVEKLKQRLEQSSAEGEGGDIGNFLSLVARLRGKDWSEELRELAQETTDRGFRKKLVAVLNTAENFLAVRTMNERGYAAPDNIQGIAWDIVATDKDDFRFGGKYAIFKRVREGEGDAARDVLRFQPDNFIEWGRSKMVAWDDDNPDSPQDMTKIISVFGAMRGVGLGEMMLTAGFFRDEDTGKILDDLKIKLIYEAWPFGEFRNDDIAYKAVSGSDSDIAPKALIPIFDKNTVTKPEVLNNLFTLTDVGEKFDPNKDTTKTGKAARSALLTYYYLADGKMLDNVLKREKFGDLALFDNNVFLRQYIKAQMYKNNIEFDWDKSLSEEANELKGFVLQYSDILFRKRNGEILTDVDSKFLQAVADKEGKYQNEKSPFNKAKSFVDRFIDLTKTTSSLFDSKGKLKKGKEAELLKSINFFNFAMPTMEQINETRERVRMSIMQSEGIDADSAEYVERFVYRMTRWTGIAARNDLDSVGHDAWSKVLNTGSYLQHQSLARRVGAFGNRYSMFQFKRIGLDLFTGVTDASGKSILETIQGGQGEVVRLDQAANTLSFPENTLKHFGTDHVIRVFQVFHRHVESKTLKLHEMVKLDKFGRAFVDEEKFNEQVRDTFLKEMRYPYATWTGIDFTEEVRMWSEDYDENGDPVKDENGNPKREFKSRPLARHMFGKEMFKNNGTYDYSVMLKYEELPEAERLDAKRYYQLEKKLNKLNRNADVLRAHKDAAIKAAKVAYRDFDKKLNAEKEAIISDELRRIGPALDERLRQDTEGALTKEEQQFMIENHNWYMNYDVKKRLIVENMTETFKEQGRGFFWKESAKVMLAAELKQGRKYFDNTQQQLSFDAVDKFLRMLSQMDANIVGNEDQLKNAKSAKKAWSDKDISQIQDMSGTHRPWMAFMDSIPLSAFGGVEGFWKALTYLFSNITK